MSNYDKKLITSCIDGCSLEQFQTTTCPHPLDEEVNTKLKTLNDNIKEENDDYEIFRYRKDIDELWTMLLEKAIKCLRFYDKREPFRDPGNDKIPKAYGIDDLKKYYDQYSEFESVLYGSSNYYRDHVIHVFRTWMLGVDLLCKNKGVCLKNFQIQEKKLPLELQLGASESISIWTIIALTHDLGYPLQKAKNVIDITRNMMSTFVTNPDISVDFAFHGVQNYMNDFIVRLMSSKMQARTQRDTASNNDSKESNTTSEAEHRESICYVARLQPKYYFKFQKSLERNSHGILSTIIIYKLLTYFLESDYSINEDYTFDEEDCRQFYIRREILRAIASHTCDDVYQMYMGSFSFLLRICDDTQEWGRKNISELYIKSNQKYELTDISLKFYERKNECEIREKMALASSENVKSIIKHFRKQSIIYVTIFRDGQDTKSRDFSFHRTLEITCDGITIELDLSIDNTKASTLIVEIKYVSEGKKNQQFNSKFFKDIPCEKELEVFEDDDYKKVAASDSAKDWKKGRIILSLIK